MITFGGYFEPDLNPRPFDSDIDSKTESQLQAIFSMNKTNSKFSYKGFW